MRNLFAALLALPNLAAAFESTSLLFLPGGLWSQNQRLVSSMGHDATATTWAVTCTPNASTATACNIPSPYMVYTIGASTMHMSFTKSQPSYDIACTLTSTLAGTCSGHVTGIAFTTTMDQGYLSSYGYRAVTITDSFPAHVQTSVSVTTTSSKSSTRASTSSGSTVESSSLIGPTSVPSGILNSFPAAAGTRTSASASATVASKSKSAGAQPMITGAMRMVAAAAVVGGAVGL